MEQWTQFIWFFIGVAAGGEVLRTLMSESRIEEFLSRARTPLACVAWWSVASLCFIATTQWWGGPSYGDADVSVYVAWALAHGHLACGYPPPGVVGYTPTAPVYPLVSGALSAVLRVGHGLPFPSSGALGASCQHAVIAMTTWALHAHAWNATLRMGYLAWFVLVYGVVSFLRSFDLGHSNREIVLVVALALTPSVGMCLWQYFHPQDIMAMGLILAALASLRRDRWWASGILFGLALLTQQFALVVWLPMVMLTPRDRRQPFLSASAMVGLLIVVPLTVATLGRSVVSSLLGTGFTSWTASLLVETGLRGDALFVVARVAPIMVALVVTWWFENRLGRVIFRPGALLSLVSLVLCLRLVFEVNLWGYYFMPVSVSLTMACLVNRRLRFALGAWLCLVTYAAFHGLAASEQGSSPLLPVWTWQIVLVGGALAIVATLMSGALAPQRRPSRSATLTARRT